MSWADVCDIREYIKYSYTTTGIRYAKWSAAIKQERPLVVIESKKTLIQVLLYIEDVLRKSSFHRRQSLSCLLEAYIMSGYLLNRNYNKNMKIYQVFGHLALLWFSVEQMFKLAFVCETSSIWFSLLSAMERQARSWTSGSSTPGVPHQAGIGLRGPVPHTLPHPYQGLKTA